jgi:hypothetical protein
MTCVAANPKENDIIKMSQTINGNVPVASIPPWMMNIVHPVDSFGSEIGNKLGPYPHYPGPIHNLGGLHIGSHCRIPGVQPFVQSILRPQTCMPHCLTKHCYEYGNTRFPPNCECNDKYDCRSYGKCNNDSRCKLKESFGGCQPSGCNETSTQEACRMAGWAKSSCGGNCSPTCGTCNHNSNVINY